METSKDEPSGLPPGLAELKDQVNKLVSQFEILESILRESRDKARKQVSPKPAASDDDR